jgi:hypothetical protein
MCAPSIHESSDFGDESHVPKGTGDQEDNFASSSDGDNPADDDEGVEDDNEEMECISMAQAKCLLSLEVSKV